MNLRHLLWLLVPLVLAGGCAEASQPHSPNGPQPHAPSQESAADPTAAPRFSAWHMTAVVSSDGRSLSIVAEVNAARPCPAVDFVADEGMDFVDITLSRIEIPAKRAQHAASGEGGAPVPCYARGSVTLQEPLGDRRIRNGGVILGTETYWWTYFVRDQVRPLYVPPAYRCESPETNINAEQGWEIGCWNLPTTLEVAPSGPKFVVRQYPRGVPRIVDADEPPSTGSSTVMVNDIRATLTSNEWRSEVRWSAGQFDLLVEATTDEPGTDRLSDEELLKIAEQLVVPE